MSVRFGDLFLSHLRLLIALESYDLDMIVARCESIELHPFNHLLALELAKFFDGRSMVAKALSYYVKCISSCPRTGLDSDMVSLSAFAYSFLRIGQIRQDKEIEDAAIRFAEEAGCTEFAESFPTRVEMDIETIEKAVQKEKEEEDELASIRSTLAGATFESSAVACAIRERRNLELKKSPRGATGSNFSLNLLLPKSKGK